MPFSISKSLPPVREMSFNKLSDLEKLEFCIQEARPGENTFESEQILFELYRWLLKRVLNSLQICLFNPKVFSISGKHAG